jgi:hypothetical protein
MPEIGTSGLMSGDGKRGDGLRPQATAPILDSTKADVARPRQKLWYPPSNAMGRLNEAADLQMALAARAERPRVLRLHTDLKIAPGYRGGPTS